MMFFIRIRFYSIVAFGTGYGSTPPGSATLVCIYDGLDIYKLQICDFTWRDWSAGMLTTFPFFSERERDMHTSIFWIDLVSNRWGMPSILEYNWSSLGEIYLMACQQHSLSSLRGILHMKNAFFLFCVHIGQTHFFPQGVPPDPSTPLNRVWVRM